jgi:uncharacterized protein
MLIISYLFAGLMLFYLIFTLFLTYLVQQIPRNPVKESPDWGTIIDARIPAIDGGSLEVWRIDPMIDPKGIVVLAHGWGRNRDRMVGRARIFAKWGFTTVLHSARDHGNSSPKRFMNALRFSEDIEAVIKWVNEPVILYGHSAGSAGAIIAASKNQHMVRLLFLEGSYAYTREALLSLYRWANRIFGTLFGPTIYFWMNLFYRGAPDMYSPARLAGQITIPVMLIHGEKDRRFPLSFAVTLKQNFTQEAISFWVAEGAGHSDSSLTSGYEVAIKSFIDKYFSA